MITSSSSTIRISAPLDTKMRLSCSSDPDRPQYKRRVCTLQVFNKHLTATLGSHVDPFERRAVRLPTTFMSGALESTVEVPWERPRGHDRGNTLAGRKITGPCGVSRAPKPAGFPSAAGRQALLRRQPLGGPRAPWRGPVADRIRAEFLTRIGLEDLRAAGRARIALFWA